MGGVLMAGIRTVVHMIEYIFLFLTVLVIVLGAVVWFWGTWKND